MKKDIIIPAVNDVYVAAIRESEDSENNWTIYLINDTGVMIENVLVTSKGYELNHGKKKLVSSTMRHQLENVEAHTAKPIELIIPETFGIHNEYWVVFFKAGKLFERRFTFTPHTIDAKCEVPLPVLLGVKGILAK
ncbi:MAG: hypothetical protein JXR07_19225 [Reichenbachiella sp.]